MNFVIDSLLCYIQAVRMTDDHGKIVQNVVGFYSHQRILQSKESIFSTAKIKMIKRKTCDSHPNPADADVLDILELLEKHGSDSKTVIPDYVSIGVDSMPSRDFDTISGVLCSLRDEISALRRELCAVRNEREHDVKILEQSDTILADLGEIKLLCRETNIAKTKGNVSVPNINSEIVSARINLPNGPSSSQPSVSFRDIVSNPSRKNAPKVKAITTVKPPVPSRTNSFFNSTVPSVSENKQHSFRKRTNVKKGTKIMSNDSRNIFCSSKPVKHIYIGGCSTDSTVDSLRQYCRDQEIDVKDVTELKTRSEYYKSFKLTVDSSLYDGVMNEDMWPQGIIFRRYFLPKNNQQ